jgi:hypothetical protein
LRPQATTKNHSGAQQEPASGLIGDADDGKGRVGQAGEVGYAEDAADGDGQEHGEEHVEAVVEHVDVGLPGGVVGVGHLWTVWRGRMGDCAFRPIISGSMGRVRGRY